MSGSQDAWILLIIHFIGMDVHLNKNLNSMIYNKVQQEITAKIDSKNQDSQLDELEMAVAAFD